MLDPTSNENANATVALRHHLNSSWNADPLATEALHALTHRLQSRMHLRRCLKSLAPIWIAGSHEKLREFWAELGSH